MADHIKHIQNWFQQAIPNPTNKSRAVQIGVHIEEFAEMAQAIDDPDLAATLDVVADDYKKIVDIGGDDVKPVALLDALCDQIVTAVGVAHMFGFDMAGALAEVNRSNWSKFVDGKPVFDAHGKIAKGPDYTPPSLMAYAVPAIAPSALPRTPADRDALLRRLAGEVSDVLDGNNIVDSIGGAVVFIVAALDFAGNAETTAWAAKKLRQVADVLDPQHVAPPARVDGFDEPVFTDPGV